MDLFGWAGGAFLPWDFDVGSVAHEGGHGIGLDHSFSNDPTYRNADWAQIGEYDDPWDALSWANSFSVPTPFGAAPSGLVAHHLDRMGWLPRSRIVVHGSNGSAEATYTVAAINQPAAAGALFIRIPYDPGDLFRYYTVEYRRQTGWSAGIPADVVLIHEVKRLNGNGDVTPTQIVWLQRDLARGTRRPPRPSTPMACRSRCCRPAATRRSSGCDPKWPSAAFRASSGARRARRTMSAFR